jgi:hypothetical protein
MLRTLTLAAILAATSIAAYADEEADTAGEESDGGVFQVEGNALTPNLIPILGCAIFCTTLLLNGSDSDEPTGSTTTTNE